MSSGRSKSEEIDELTRDSNLRLSDLRKAIPIELRQPVEWRSWLTLLRVLLCMALCLWVLSTIEIRFDSMWWQLPFMMVAWFFYGAVLLGFFLIGHDCGHGSFSRHPRINKAVGSLCMAPIFNGFRTWTLTHDHHHLQTQIRGEDVDWSSHLVTKDEFKALSWRHDFAIKLGYSMPFGIFWWIMWNAIQRGSHVKPMLKPRVFARNKKAIRASNILMLCVTVTVYGSFYYFTGFWGLLKYHHIPVSIASLLGGVMVSVGHANINTLWYDRRHWTPLRGQLVSTYDYRFPRLLEYLVLNINVHIPHHISVAIPWYSLSPAARELKAKYPDLYQELPFRWRDMSWIVWAPFIVYDPGRGVYKMQLRDAA